MEKSLRASTGQPGDIGWRYNQTYDKVGFKDLLHGAQQCFWIHTDNFFVSFVVPSLEAKADTPFTMAPECPSLAPIDVL